MRLGSRNDDALLLLGALEDDFIACCLELVVADVCRVVSGGAQPLGDDGRERVVYEKPHAEAASGISRSRTASAA